MICHRSYGRSDGAGLETGGEMADSDGQMVSRRAALRLGVGGLIGLAAPAIIGSRTAFSAPLRNGQILTTPNLNLRPDQYTVVAGLRPQRVGGVRIGLDPVLSRDIGKTVIHNYGHGGAGITLSFGCAARVVTALETIFNAQPRSRVAILGSGIAGMTVAFELLSRWHQLRLRILTRSQNIEDSTSWVAGGQFGPSGILQYYQQNPGELVSMVRGSADRVKAHFSKGSAQRFGIRQRFNYSLGDVLDLKAIKSVIGEPKTGNLPFEHLTDQANGYEYNTYLIEPKIALKELAREVTKNGGRILWGHPVGSLQDMAQLPETVIVNCTGLGSWHLIGDHALSAVEGQLAVLKNTQALKYFVSGGCNGTNAYMFGRTNDLTIGGTTDDIPIRPDRLPVARPDINKGDRLVKRMRTFLGGHPEQCV